MRRNEPQPISAIFGNLLTSQPAAKYTRLIDENAHVCATCGGDGWKTSFDARGRSVVERCPSCDGASRERVAIFREAAKIPPTRDDVPLAPPIAAYAERIKQRDAARPWLVIAGPPGTGKTTQAANVARAVVERGVSTRFCFAPALFRTLRADMHRNAEFEEIAAPARRVGLLVLDDFLRGLPNPKSFEADAYKSLIFDILWARSDARLPTILTMNVTLDAIKNYDDALFSRVVGLSTVAAPRRGTPDYRQIDLTP